MTNWTEAKEAAEPARQTKWQRNLRSSQRRGTRRPSGG